MGYQLSATLKGHDQDVRDVVAVDDSKVASVSRMEQFACGLKMTNGSVR